MELKPEELLSRYTVLQTRDVAEFHAVMVGEEGRYVSREVGPGDFYSEVRMSTLGQIVVALAYCSVAMTVERARQPSNSYLLQLPLTGSFQVDGDGKTYSVTPDAGAIISPGKRLRRQGQPGWTLVFQIPHECVRARFELISGTSLNRPIVFQPLLSSAATDVRSYCLLIAAAIDREPAICGGAAADMLASGLVELLLTRQSHNQAELLQEVSRGRRSQRVRVISNYVDEHLREAIRVEQLAAAADCSVRTLQKTLVELCGMTPVEFVRARRLAFARRLLESDDVFHSVTHVARQSGFSQAAHFSAYYKEMYGETPKDTLQRVTDRSGHSAGHQEDHLGGGDTR